MSTNDSNGNTKQTQQDETCIKPSPINSTKSQNKNLKNTVRKKKDNEQWLGKLFSVHVPQ